MESLPQEIGALPVLWLGFGASLAAGLCTGAGALPVLWGRQVSPARQNTMLGFAAGVMLAATAFSLILPGLEAAAEATGSQAGAAGVVAAGVLLGAAALALFHRILPHEHFIKGREGADVAGLRRVWLFIFAITLHNLPEGLAVGVGFGGGNIANGAALAIGIGLQNLPEGLAVAVAMLAAGYARGEAFATAALTGLVEPVGGVIGAGAVTFATPLLPWGLAFAAGAMLFVISDEIIPETHRKGRESRATAGLMLGFVVMMVLDVTMA